MHDWRLEVRRRLENGKLDPRSEAEIVEELAQHVEDRYRDLCSRGSTEADAAAAVLAELDADADLGGTIDSALRPLPPADVPIGASRMALPGGFGDLRIAVRLLRRSPVFTVVTVLLIGLGIGANTTVFSVGNALLLRPLPGVERPQELAAVFTSDYSGPLLGSSSYPDYRAMRDAGALSDLAAYRQMALSIAGPEGPVRVLGEVVSPNYFRVLGVRLARGRVFFDDPVEGTGVVISDAFWTERYGRTPDVVGRTMRLNGQLVSVAGVAPPAFRGMLRGVRVDVWFPIEAPTPLEDAEPANRGNRSLQIVGRLADGRGLGAARAALALVAAKLHAEFPDQFRDRNNRPRVLSVLSEKDAKVPPPLRAAALGLLGLLTLVVLLVLLVACTNVANLMLTRAAARRAEMGVRIALGATRGRIVVHLLTESLLLAALGGALGVVLTVWLIGLLALVPPTIGAPVNLDIGVDGRVLAFAALLTTLTAVLFGSAPALHAARAPAPLLREARAERRMGLRHALVVVQIAASFILLLGGSLFLRTLIAAQGIDRGFATRNMVIANFGLDLEGIGEDEAQQFLQRARERAAALPAVRSATLAEWVPLGLGYSRRGLVIDGYQAADGNGVEVVSSIVSDGYFEAMGIALRRGRTFTAADRAGAPLVAVVNETFVRQYLGGGSGIGRRVSNQGDQGPWLEIVGVVEDGKYVSLSEAPTPYVYIPYAQYPRLNMMLQLVTAGDPAALLPGLRAELRALAPDRSPPTLITLEQHVATSQIPQRIAALAFSGLGAIALIIAVIGLYGIIAYNVLQRRREIGVRMALGALAGQVRSVILRQGLRLTAIGLLVGTPLAAALAFVLRSLLLVPPFDPVSFLAVLLLLGGAATLASYLPARAATRVDPMLPLRES